MKYLAAYLLATLSGTASPSKEDITTILSSIGAEVDDSRIEKLISELEGKDVNELIAEGSTKLASVPTGGAGAAAGGAAAGAATEAAEETKAEPEAAEESDDDMGFGLFD